MYLFKGIHFLIHNTKCTLRHIQIFKVLEDRISCLPVHPSTTLSVLLCSSLLMRALPFIGDRRAQINDAVVLEVGVT